MRAPGRGSWGNEGGREEEVSSWLGQEEVPSLPFTIFSYRTEQALEAIPGLFEIFRSNSCVTQGLVSRSSG